MTSCPGCQRPMRAVEIPVQAGAAESAFACPYCSGVLVLTDALTRAVGRPLRYLPDPGAETRTCPSCEVTMATEKVEQVVIDRCAGCARVYLDAQELEHIAGRPLFVRKTAKASADYAAADADYRRAQQRNQQRSPGRLPRSLFGVRRGSLFDFNE